MLKLNSRKVTVPDTVGKQNTMLCAPVCRCRQVNVEHRVIINLGPDKLHTNTSKIATFLCDFMLINNAYVA